MIQETKDSTDESDRERRRSIIGSLGRQDSEDKLTIYIKQEAEPSGPIQQPSIVPTASPALSRRLIPTSNSVGGVGDADSPSSRLLSRYRHSLDVNNDLLRTIEEVDKEKQGNVADEEGYDSSPAPLPAVIQCASGGGSASEREKKRYQRTMTPNTLRSKLQEKLISGFDTSELAGTIASMQIPSSPKTEILAESSSSDSVPTQQPVQSSQDTKKVATAQQTGKEVKEVIKDVKDVEDVKEIKETKDINDVKEAKECSEESEVALPPCGPRRTLRRSSRGTLGDDGPFDKIEIDSENIETPPVTRRAYGPRPFRSVRDTCEEGSARSTPSATEASQASRTKVDDDELGDGRFDRFSSIRRTRRLRKAPEGAEEDSANLEPRKSPEGVEDPEDALHAPPDVIVGMEVKKEGEVTTVEVTRRPSEERDLLSHHTGSDEKDRRLSRWKELLSSREQDSPPSNGIRKSQIDADPEVVSWRQ